MKVPKFQWGIYGSDAALQRALDHGVFRAGFVRDYPTQVNAYAVDANGRQRGYLAWFEFDRVPTDKEVAEYTPILRDMVIARYGLQYEKS